jgi:hypothetical protein
MMGVPVDSPASLMETGLLDPLRGRREGACKMCGGLARAPKEFCYRLPWPGRKNVLDV